MTIRDAFDAFASGLEIDGATISEAKRLHEAARAALAAKLTGHLRTFLSGSYPRNTRLNPLNDIDIIAVVESTEPWGHQPAVALTDAGQIVAAEFEGSVFNLGNHSAKVSNLDSRIEDVHVDVVVARESGPGTVLEISERSPTIGWIRSDPEAHAEELSARNGEWDLRIVPVVKMIKHWNRREADSDSRLPSFLVEAIALHVFEGSGVSPFSEMVQRYFDRAAEKIKAPTTSPAVPDGYVDPDLETWRRGILSDRLRRAATDAAEALRIEGDDPSGALEIWHRIFNDPFPAPDAEGRASELAKLLRDKPAASIAGGTITTSTEGRRTVPGRAYGEEP